MKNFTASELIKTKKYVISSNASTGSENPYSIHCELSKNGTNAGQVGAYGKLSEVIDLSPYDYDTVAVFILISANKTCNNVTFRPQLELGETATEYEPYITPSAVTASLYTPLKSGEYIDIIGKKRYNSGNSVSDISVTGELKAVQSPTNSITCDTKISPAKIEAEYYQDINKVVAELKSAILAQGGNI